ncbi:hypothetical protein ES705_40800 [subsurface metagenome]
MKNKWFLSILTAFIVLVSCRKDESVIPVIDGMTRIDYTINNPLEMAHLEFEFNNVHNLSNHTLFSIELIANENSNSLSLLIMLEDRNGHRNDIDPFMIAEDKVISDGTLHTYDFDVNKHLASTTSSTNEITLNRISKVLIYINAGLTGKVAEGFFWLDNVQFRTDS